MSVLKDQYGSDVILYDEQGREVTYRIMAEIQYQHKLYAVLQSKAMAKEGEIEVFQALQQVNGQWELETVEDEAVWEDVAELYDEMVYEKFAGQDD